MSSYLFGGDESLPAPPPPSALAKASPRPAAPKRGEKRSNSFRIAGESASGNVNLSNPRPHPPHDPNAPDLIAFAAIEFVCFECEPSIVVTLVRRGTGKGEITCDWATENGNVSPESYNLQSGKLVFEDGQMTNSLTLEVLDNPAWSTESLQYVQLSELTGNAVFGMDRTTVIILNDDPFPQGVEDSEDQFAMVKGFIQHNYNDLKGATHWGILFMLYPAIGFIWNQLILMDLMMLFKYMDSSPPGQTESLMMYKLPPALSAAGRNPRMLLMFRAAYYLINYALGHYINFKFRNLKLGGRATLALRTQMINQILQLTPAAQEIYPTGKTAKIMGAQIENAMSTTWAAFFKMTGALIQLGCMIGFSWYLVILNIQAEVFEFPAFISILFFLIPILMIGFDGAMLKMNINQNSILNIETMERADDWADFVIESGDLKSLVQTYRQDYNVAMDFRGLHKKFNGCNFKTNMFEAGTLWNAKWFPLTLATVVMIVAGMQVMDNVLPLGSFLALFNTTNNFGNVIANLFGGAFAMGEGYASIKKIAALLNQPTMRKEKHLHKVELEKRIGEFETLHGKLDPTKLVVHAINYTYHDDGSRTHHPVLPDNLNFTLEPGQMIALTGSSACGKATLLSLIAGAFIPTEGFAVFPSNWRTRFADGVPRLYDTSLIYNLRFGEFVEHPEAEIWALCAKLGLSHDLLGVPEFDVGFMGEKIPFSDRVVVTVARILLSSVDLVLLASTLDGIGERHMERVIKVLHELIDHRGLPVLDSEVGSQPLALRKVKTVILSSKLHHVCDLADSVLNIS